MGGYWVFTTGLVFLRNWISNLNLFKFKEPHVGAYAPAPAPPLLPEQGEGGGTVPVIIKHEFNYAQKNK